MNYLENIDYWLAGLFLYLIALLLTFIPILRALLQKIEPKKVGDSFETSPYFSATEKEALRQHFSRISGTLGYWKNKAAFYEGFHFYCLIWTIPSAVLIPILTNGITQDNYSKLSVTIISTVTAILLAFHKGLKVEDNFKSFRHGESEFYDLYRRLLDTPEILGQTGKEQIDAYFKETENIRRFVRNTETDNLATLDEAKKQLNKNKA